MAKGKSKRPLTIGGQAVMEGVMMRGPHWVSVAVRKPDGRIDIATRRHESVTRRLKWLGAPVLRGMVSMAETLWLGIGVLNQSAQMAADEKTPVRKSDLALAAGISAVLAVALFKLLPLWLAGLVARENFWLNILDGFIKLGLFVGYIALVGRLADVKTLFRYHGAEHKSVNCYEAARPLTVSEAARFTKAQPRCGTTFVFFVIFLSIFVNMFIPWTVGFWAKFGLRLLLLPLVAGLAYEVIRLGVRFGSAPWFLAFIAPGMFLQGLTTKEPDAAQLEVGLAALRAVLEREQVLPPQEIAVAVPSP